MVSSEQATEIALDMPECEAGAHQGHPDFRVRGRIFMTLWPEDDRAVIRLAEADQTALVTGDPDTFSLPGWAHQGWTGVDLRNVDADRFRDRHHGMAVRGAPQARCRPGRRPRQLKGSNRVRPPGPSSPSGKIGVPLLSPGSRGHRDLAARVTPL